MVKLIKIRDKSKSLTEKVFAVKKLGRRKVITLVIIIVLIIGSIIFLIAKRGTDPAVSCSEVNQQTKAAYLESKTKPFDYESTYSNLNEQSASCETKKKILGIGASESEENRLNQLQYYYERAKIGYSLGKTDQAKEDAQKALDINSKLKDADKKLENHAQIIQALEHVRDGTY